MGQSPVSSWVSPWYQWFTGPVRILPRYRSTASVQGSRSLFRVASSALSSIFRSRSSSGSASGRALCCNSAFSLSQSLIFYLAPKPGLRGINVRESIAATHPGRLQEKRRYSNVRNMPRRSPAIVTARLALKDLLRSHHNAVSFRKGQSGVFVPCIRKTSIAPSLAPTVPYYEIVVSVSD